MKLVKGMMIVLFCGGPLLEPPQGPLEATLKKNKTSFYTVLSSLCLDLLHKQQ